MSLSRRGLNGWAGPGDTGRGFRLSLRRFAPAALAPVLLAVLTAAGARAQAPLQAPETQAKTGRPLGKLEQESVDEALGGLGLTARPQPRGQDDRDDLRRQRGRVLAPRLVLPALQHLPPHDARGRPAPRAAVQAGPALRRGARRGEHAQPAVAADGRAARRGKPLVAARAVERRRHRARGLADAGHGRRAGRDARRVEPALQHELRVPAEHAVAPRHVAVREQPLRLAEVPLGRASRSTSASTPSARPTSTRTSRARACSCYANALAYLHARHRATTRATARRSRSSIRSIRWRAAGARG